MATKKFCIIGLGYFGKNLALDLHNAGAEVIAIDRNPDNIEDVSNTITQAICMDATDKKALASMEIPDMDAVIVAIGEGFESSIMTTALLQELGARKIINRVTSPVHERLLSLLQVDEILVPEAEAAEHLASRLMTPGLIGSLEISGHYGIYEIKAPEIFVGRTLLEIDMRSKYSLNLVTIKRNPNAPGEKVIGVPGPNTDLRSGDILVLFGHENDIKKILKT